MRIKGDNSNIDVNTLDEKRMIGVRMDSSSSVFFCFVMYMPKDSDIASDIVMMSIVTIMSVLLFTDELIPKMTPNVVIIPVIMPKKIPSLLKRVCNAVFILLLR